MSKSENETKIIKNNITKRLSDNLFEYFYLFGIEPESLDISELTDKANILEKNFKSVQLLTKFPPFERILSNITPNTVMNHCFPNGYSFIENDNKPEDDFFHFNLENLFDLWPENKKLYFNCVIIYEPLKSYLNIKYKNNIPDLDEENKNKLIPINKIYIPKAVCFSSFVCFPYEVKLLMSDLLRYIGANNITLPIEKVIETIVLGIPRPLRAYFYPLCSKDKLIPGISQEISFNRSEFNQYHSSSYPFQSILRFSSTSILSIYRGLLLEMPILFFSSKKEILANIVETFLSLLHPFEYQYPHISILPDSNAGLIELEKSYVFGINHKLEIVKKDELTCPKYFLDNNLNLINRALMLANIDNGKVNAFCQENGSYHVVNFEDLGVYNNTNTIDSTQKVSKDLYTGRITDIIEDAQLPEKYTEKLITKIEDFKKKLKSESYNIINNKTLGEGFFYYYLASILINYNNYLFNKEDEIKKIYNEILTKKEDEIDIENLFDVNRFLQDYKTDASFYGKFFKTKIFKNFIIRKYLNRPLDRYTLLHFDEKILFKRNKYKFAKKVKIQFINSVAFQSTRAYQVISPKNFNEEEISFIKQKKEILSYKYYQTIDDKNNIKYLIFPKLIYDNIFFEKKYIPGISFSKNSILIECLNKYQAIEDNLRSNAFNSFFSIYNGDLVNRSIIDINKIEYHNEIINSLYLVWIIVFCMTFYYCDELEKNFRFEELMRFLPKVIDYKEKIISILIITIDYFGDKTMMIKLFDLLKKIKYSEYACLCSKFKSDIKINWDIKKIEVSNSKIILSYFRDPKTDVRKLSEVKTIDYDIKSIKKRTFYISEDYRNDFSDNEKLSFDLFYKCPHCEQTDIINSLVVNLESKMKNTFMICSECKKYMRPISHVVFGTKKEEFVIYSPIELLKMAKNILKENGIKLNMDDLRTKYNTFFWNCIVYFKFNNLSFEMLLKYKNKKASKEIIVPKKKRRAFKILECQKQEDEI